MHAFNILFVLTFCDVFHVNYHQVIKWSLLQISVMSTCKYFKDYILHLLYRLLQFCCLWKNSLVPINFNCVKKRFKIHTSSYKFLFFHKGEKNQLVTLSTDHKLLKFILTEEQFICQLSKPLGHITCSVPFSHKHPAKATLAKIPGFWSVLAWRAGVGREGAIKVWKAGECGVGGGRLWPPCSPISKFSLARALFKEFLIIVYLNSERWLEGGWFLGSHGEQRGRESVVANIVWRWICRKLTAS